MNSSILDSLTLQFKLTFETHENYLKFLIYTTIAKINKIRV